MEKDAKIYVAGHRGMVGGAIVRSLQRQGYTNIVTRTHAELDLCRQDQVEAFFRAERPEYVFLAAAKVGGIIANQTAPADFISVMPTNLYGPGDNYHPEHSHVLPALIRRFHEAKEQGLDEVTCWGDGSPLREFLYVDDLADLCVFLMEHYSGNETVNAGTGEEISIRGLTELVARIVGYHGRILWDTTRPNGTPRKLLDVSKATRLGWQAHTSLEEGIRLTYDDFLNNPMRAER